jgi:PASTA domain
MPKSKKRLRQRAILAALGTCIAILALAGIAQAETLTLGAALTGTEASPAFCSPLGEGGCGEMTVAAAAPSVGTRSPVDGTIVRWRIRGSSATPGYSLNVLRKNSDGSYTVTASTGSVTPSGNEIETLASSLPIHSGEYLELDIPYSGYIAQVEGKSTNAFFPPSVGVGETGAASGEEEIPFVFGYNADIEDEATRAPPAPIVTPAPIVPPTSAPAAEAHCVVPKLKGKKLKAAKRATRAADCKLGHVAKKKGVTAKPGKVVKQSPKAGKVLSAGSKVSVKLG